MRPAFAVALAVVVGVAMTGLLLFSAQDDDSASPGMAWAVAGHAGAMRVKSSHRGMVAAAAPPQAEFASAGYAGEGAPQMQRMLADADTFVSSDGGGAEPMPERMIVRNGNVNVVVDSLADARDRIVTFVQGKKGFVSSSYDQEYGVNLVLSVPVDEFDEVMAFVRGLAKRVTYSSTSAEDVTQQYVDAEARARNLEAVHKQLLQLMQKATEVKDIVVVQQELTRVTEQMEVHKARLQYLSRSASMSSVVVSLSLEDNVGPRPTPKPIFDLRIGETFMRAVRMIGSIVSGVISGFVFIMVIGVPMAAVACCLWIPLRALDRRNGWSTALTEHIRRQFDSIDAKADHGSQ